ncbi:hypothetical protein IQ06DRAFT_360987 [Phaeosphaeriaceae sp. SRC1lsM3a]|nr:hypothetical protein IQ06DRAFT_360987 [Stagonospora sp. SRC1lsM3a]
MPFPFLDSSPEMRNSVYGYAIQFDETAFDYFHPTHACRQIRSGIRPLYIIKRTWAEIQDFLPVWDRHDQPAGAAYALIAIRARFFSQPGCPNGPNLPLTTSPDVQVKVIPTLPTNEGDKIAQAIDVPDTARTLIGDDINFTQ